MIHKPSPRIDMKEREFASRHAAFTHEFAGTHGNSLRIEMVKQQHGESNNIYHEAVKHGMKVEAGKTADESKFMHAMMFPMAYPGLSLQELVNGTLAHLRPALEEVPVEKIELLRDRLPQTFSFDAVHKAMERIIQERRRI